MTFRRRSWLLQLSSFPLAKRWWQLRKEDPRERAFAELAFPLPVLFHLLKQLYIPLTLCRCGGYLALETT